MSIKTCIIGSGKSAANWSKYISFNNNFKLVYCLSRDRKRGEDFAKKNNCIHIETIDEIFENNKINLVIIATEPKRRNFVNKLFGKFKYIIIEKPLSLNLHETKELYSNFKISKTICASGLNRHYDTFLKVVKKDIQDELIGQVHSVYYYGFHKGSKNEKQFSKETEYQQGNLVIGGLVHKFEQLNFLFGHPIDIMARVISKTHEDVGTHYFITISYEKNIICNINYKEDNGITFGEKLEIYTKNGQINVNHNSKCVDYVVNEFFGPISLKKIFHKLYSIVRGYKFDISNNRRIIKKFKFNHGSIKNILDEIEKKNNKEDCDLVGMEQNYLTTMMSLACQKSIKTSKIINIDEFIRT